MAPPKTLVTAVLRIGQDRLTVAVVDRDLRIRSRRDAPSARLTDAPYPALDHHHVWRWLVAVLRDFGEAFQLEAIVPTAFGGTAALIDGNGLVLPVMHKAAEPPPDVRGAFAEAAPSAAAVGMATPAHGASLALQLWWQRHAFPDAFARTTRLLSHAAYWGFCLTDGVPASEASSLAEGGQLIELPSCRPSTLARQDGTAKLVATLREPHQRLGRLAPSVATMTELPATTPVLVGCSDRAAAHGLLLAARLDDAALLLAEERIMLVPGSRRGPVHGRLVLSVDRRPLLEFAVDDDAGRTAVLLAAAEHRGPLIIAGAWAPTTALAALLKARGKATFLLEDDGLWAQGAAFLAALGRRPPVPRLPLVRVPTEGCAETPPRP